MLELTVLLVPEASALVTEVAAPSPPAPVVVLPPVSEAPPVPPALPKMPLSNEEPQATAPFASSATAPATLRKKILCTAYLHNCRKPKYTGSGRRR
jgi:hypothetical protein